MVTIEKLAEDYTELNPPMVKEHYRHSEGNYYITTPIEAGDDSVGFAKYNIVIPAHGIYKIVALTLGESIGHNSFYVSWNYSNKIIFDFVPTLNFKWTNVSSRGSGEYLHPEYPIHAQGLMAGPHTLIIYSREIKAKLKKLVVTDDLDYLVPSTTTTPSPSPTLTPTPTYTPAPTITPSPTPGNSYTTWLNSKGGKPGLKNNLSALIEMIDGYLGFKNMNFSISLANILTTIDGYLGF